MKIIDLNGRYHLCGSDEATIKIVLPANEDGSIPAPIYCKTARSKKEESDEWSPSKNIVIDCPLEEYMKNIEEWFDNASESDSYTGEIIKLYGKIPDLETEVKRAMTWLLENARYTGGRRKDINMFFRNWLRRRLNQL